MMGKMSKNDVIAIALRAVAGVVLAAITFSSHANTLSGVVISVHDGDTLTLLDSAKQQHSIRLMGIDAPEMGQPYSQRSRDALRGAVIHQFVTVELSKNKSYKRQIGQVFRDGKDINLEQVASGMAWHYAQYEREQKKEDRQRYAQTQAAAQRTRAGLWHDQSPIAPWEWRKARRKE